jgi:RNA polymerase sigma factor (sigma-70 family)
MTRYAAVSYEDIFSCGHIGLIKAFQRFDRMKYDGAFSTFAYKYIAGEIQRFARDCAIPIKAPRSLYQQAGDMIKRDLWDASVSEITEKMGYTVDEANNILRYLHKTNIAALDQPISIPKGDKSNDVTALEVMGTETDFSSIYVSEFMDKLSAREKTIVRFRLEGMTQGEIAVQIGVTQVQISRLLVRIGEKLSKHMGLKVKKKKSKAR